MTQQGFFRRRGGEYPRRARPPSKELWQERTKAARLGERRGMFKYPKKRNKKNKIIGTTSVFCVCSVDPAVFVYSGR